MSHKYISHKSSLFLLELIMAILFFSIVSAVCVQIFVKAHTLSQDAALLSTAVNECSDAAEIIYSSNNIEHALKKLHKAYPHAAISENIVIIPYDNTHTLIINFSIPETQEDTKQIYAHISFTDQTDNHFIYELNIIHKPKESLHE